MEEAQIHKYDEKYQQHFSWIIFDDLPESSVEKNLCVYTGNLLSLKERD